ncbi:MAG: CHRD domain-containing protein [Burkholderiales bacterium]
MNALQQSNRPGVPGIVAAAVVFLAACSSMAYGDRGAVTLGGDQEVPAVMTSASASGTIAVNADKSVSGSVTTSAVAGTMAHIHIAAAGKNGPVIIPLTKSGDSTWSVPAGAKLTDAQYEAYKAGGLYVNVHSAAHKGGEIRGQLKP